ncbi:MAG: cysteine hydrolase family protein [Candidatus Hodarchaeales archaeon]|jgi:nicotinamidase-related amidase
MTISILVLDLQVGNFTGSSPIFQGEVLLENTQKILQIVRKRGVKVIYIQNMGGKGDPDEVGSDGWEIHPKIKPKDKDTIIQKTTPDSFHKTKLHKILQSMNVNSLIVLGLQTEYCIDTTIRRAFTLEYEVTLVKDCHSTWHSQELSASQIINHHNSVLGGYFANLISTKELEEGDTTRFVRQK